MANPVTFGNLSSVPEFSSSGPTDHASTWLDTIEEFGALFHWTPAQCLSVARCRLSGNAKLWEQGIRSTVTTWEEFRAAFTSRFALRPEILYQRLNDCRQGKFESTQVYTDRFRSLCTQLRINTATDLPHLYQFLDGLRPEVYNKVILLKPSTLDEAMEHACYIDQWDRDNRMQNGAPRMNQVSGMQNAASADSRDSRNSSDGERRVRFDNDYRTGTLSRQPPRDNKPMPRDPRHDNRPHFSQDRHDTRGPQDQGFRPRPPANPSTQPAQPATEPSVEEITRNLAKLSLMLKRAGVGNVETLMHDMVAHAAHSSDAPNINMLDRIGSTSYTPCDLPEITPDTLTPCMQGANTCLTYDHMYNEDPSIYVKRVGEFDNSATIPNKRTAVAPGMLHGKSPLR